MAENASDLVLASKLETEFFAGCVKHRRYTTESSFQEPQTQVEEIWDAELMLGRGTFGTVRLERRRPHSSGPNSTSLHQVRAVKEISKTVPMRRRWDHLKELEAIAKFSQPRVSEAVWQPSMKVIVTTR